MIVCKYVYLHTKLEMVVITWIMIILLNFAIYLHNDKRGKLIKYQVLHHTRYKKPYFYDILSGKVNPPPPERQFAMLKLLNPTEEQRNLFFDLAAQERNEVPADIAEILKDKELCSELRKNINYKKYLRMEIAK